MFAASKTASVTSGYQISRSLRFNRADSAYLNRTPASTGSRTTFTLSLWLKLGSFATGNDSLIWSSGDAASGNPIALLWKTFSTNYYFNITGTSTEFATTQLFRDPSAWYHIVLAVDTTQATDTNRIKLYVNGVQVTSFTTATYPAQNFTYDINTASYSAYLGTLAIGASRARYWDGYQTEVNFTDGSQLTPSSFGETSATTGVWQPKLYTGSYGTNGFYLNFSDNSNTTAATLGKDYSGNGNNWTPNNFSVTAGVGNDSFVDSPTSYAGDTGAGGEVRGNYCILNAIALGSATLTNGNLDASVGGDANGAYGTIGVSSGKWYWEVLYVSGTNAMIGIANMITGTGAWVNAYGWAYYEDGAKYTNNTRSAGYGASYGTNAIISVALDMDAGTLTFYKNGTSQGVAYSSLSGTMTPYLGNGGGSSAYTINLGQRPFSYTAPNGYKALCTQNLPTPTIGATNTTLAGVYFNPVLYTGTGSSLGVTGVGFQPDWVWVKSRSAATDHAWYDAVRGVQKQIESNTSTAETTETTGLTAFGSDGFTTGALAQMNTSAATYVAWNWKANGAGSSNTSGSITSTVSASTTSGFSVVTYTGTGVAGTIGHGLGVAPSMIMVKSRSASGAWPVYQSTLGNGSNLYLNTTAASASSATIWNSTSPTSSVFSVGINTESNTVTVTYVAYCFAPIAGYSAFGSFVGNGSSNGPFVFTGFKPAYVMVKKTSSTSDWLITDAARDTYNVVNKELDAQGTFTEGSGFSFFDYLSNGFKSRGANPAWNTNGDTYIYMAFASNPFKYSLAR